MDLIRSTVCHEVRGNMAPQRRVRVGVSVNENYSALSPCTLIYGFPHVFISISPMYKYFLPACRYSRLWTTALIYVVTMSPSFWMRYRCAHIYCGFSIYPTFVTLLSQDRDMF